jgi:hypothetical protein
MSKSAKTKKKNFSRFTVPEAFKLLGLTELNPWNPEAEPMELSPFFEQRLQRLAEAFDLQSCEESKKLLIDAICEEAILTCPHLRIWKGPQLESDVTTGYVDYLIAERKRYLETPFLCIVEAKKDDFEQGLAQCLVQMKACQHINLKVGQAIEVWGIVSNGKIWQFYRLNLKGQVDETPLYSIRNLSELLGQVRYLFQMCESNLIQLKRS